MDAPIDSRQLRAFVTLAETGSFTQSAKRLHLSQSAVSHSIKALEDDLSCRLFDRVGKRTLLTLAGEHLLRRSEKIFQEMTAARSEIKRLEKWGHGRLRVSASASACQYVLPPVLREFKESFPQCDIIIEPGDHDEALELLQHNRVDLALTLEPGHDDQFESRHLFADELQFLVAPQHPWAKSGHVVREEIAKQSYILHLRKSYTYRLIEGYFGEDNIALRSVIEFGSLEAIKALVKLGLGVSILAPWIAREELAAHTLVALPLGKRKLKRRWSIVYWRGRRLSLPEETFVGLCQAATARLA